MVRDNQYHGTPCKRKLGNTLNASEEVPFQHGERIYIKSSGCWVEAVLKDITETRVTSLLPDGKEVVCSKDDVLHGSSAPLDQVDQLSDLAPLNQATVLYCLGKRLEKQWMYTRAGSTVVALNPFTAIPRLYTLDNIANYHLNNSQVKSPHIYEIAERAYSSLLSDSTRQHQCVIVSGESGAGKTVSAKHLLRYLTVVANPLTEQAAGDRKLSECSGRGRDIERKILDSNPILEAFGNAATPRNENSSRFGKFIQLQFQSKGHIGGASIDTYLLEKTRVVHQGPGDCNFHVFYQLCGEQRQEFTPGWLQELQDQMKTHTFNIVPCHNVKERKSLQDTLEAMSDIGLSELMQQEVFKVIASILFLCNMKFSALEEETSRLSSQSASCEATSQCCSLLSVDPESLEQVLLHRNIASGGDKRRSVFVKPVSIAEAQNRRDCLAMLLYSRLFEWLVDFINQQIKCEGTSNIVGVLDIYGFEMFESNSLEQLCINYANEKLQQHYVRHFLKDLQREYEEERIPWQHIDYHDNQACLDILEGKVGVFGVLNEEVYLNRKSNARVLGERVLELSPKTQGSVKRPKTFSVRPGFIVQHYAGHVMYDVQHITNKNKDNIPVELISLLQQSDNTFISQLFGQVTAVEASGKKKKTVLTKFKASLDSLLSTLKSSNVHYIRCIKPNRASEPGKFDPGYVLQQLSASGILETVEISRRGYSTRLGYWDFLQRYGLLLREETDPGKESPEDPVTILLNKHLDQSSTPRKSATPQRILRRRTGLSSLDHTRKCCAAVMTKVLGPEFLRGGALRNQFGKNKIFLLQAQFEMLEISRNKLHARYAKVIQKSWRTYRVYQNKKRCDAVAVIARCWRRYKHNKRRRTAATCIQRAARCWLSRMRFHTAMSTLRKEKTTVSCPPPEQTHDHECQMSPVPNPTCPKKITIPGSAVFTETGTRKRKSSEVDPHPNLQNNICLDSPRKRKSSETKENRSVHPSVSDDSGVDTSVSDNHDDAQPPMKKLKTSCSKYGRLGEMHVGEGVVTCRKLATSGMRFHTRQSVLKNAHIVNKRELQRGLTDCLKDD